MSEKPDYDAQRAEAELVTCAKCQKPYYMGTIYLTTLEIRNKK
jgi:hypothetical protein